MHRPICIVLPAVAAVIALCCGGIAEAQQRPADFNRDVRGILADNCFHCHGRDANKRKADLRLDSFEDATRDGAIVPGNTEKSALVARISSTDPDFMMPPLESKRSLDKTQIDLLTRWVAEGAVYMPHWAFIPLQEVEVPELDDPGAWMRNPIDHFVLRRLRAEGLSPAGEAAKETLLRRVTLDLSGLPPSPAEVAAFVQDPSPDAYEKVVERLLVSPAYGERMAKNWLDVARYADTYGYQNDRETKTWPWRDWVIEAFTNNLPYDDFILWQLAGDLLPNPTREQRIATAFNRLHRQTNEGGSINEEWRTEYVADRVHTFSTAFLGVTMECARCHSHKFDPVSQTEYYQLFSFFNNIDESGLYSHFTDATPTPALLLTTPEDDTKAAALKEDLWKAELAVADARAEARPRFEAWLADTGRRIPPLAPVLHLPLDAITDGKTENTADANAPATVAGGLALEPGVAGQALRFTGEDPVDCADAGDFDRTQPFTLALWVNVGAHVEHTVVVHKTKAASDAGSRGYELLLEEGRPAFGLTHFWPGNAIRIEAREPIPTGQWVHLAVTYDGQSKAAGAHVYQDGREVETVVIRDHLYKSIRYENQSDDATLRLGERFRDFGFKNNLMDEFEVFDRALTAVEVESLARQEAVGGAVARRLEGPDPARDAALLDYYCHAVDTPCQEALASLKLAWEAHNTFVSAVPELMVMQEMDKPRQAHVLARGAYDQPTEAVEPGTPESILPFRADLPRNRLGLAKWLLDPKNPLTARVAVNRYWQIFFGRGIVETQEDFGTQGRPPTHPDLLDWLAYQFMTSGWDLKALNRLIVTSATYRQDSSFSPDLRERDPLNQLFAHGPRNRLQAEAVRDAALAASSLLVAKVGGPSVKPYQTPGIWEESSSLAYQPDTGEGLYRRSMYTFWKRTVPPPTMLSFDAPSREVCVARREVTATPLQALILLNDPQFVEAARVLADHVLAAHPEDLDAQMGDLFLALLGRAPDAGELGIAKEAYAEQRGYFNARAEEAAAYTSVGETPRDEAQDLAQLAASTAIAQLVMNFDAFQMNY